MNPGTNPGTTRTVAVILGAGRPHRGDAPASLQAVGDDRVVLEWVLDALAGRVDEVLFVGGYHVDEISDRFKEIRYVINAHWQETGSVGSLFSVLLDERCRYLVIYGDIVFDAGLVERMLGLAPGEVGVAVEQGPQWSRRDDGTVVAKEMVVLDGDEVRASGYARGPDGYDAEFIGMMVLPGAVVESLNRSSYRKDGALAGMHLSGLLQRLVDDGLRAVAVTVGEQRWAEINEPRDLAAFVFGTKAETLSRLKSLVRKSEIGSQVAFSVGRWREDPEGCIAAIRAMFDASVVVRSSALSEDGWEGSNAGAHLSLLDLPPHDEGGLRRAVEEVIASYGDDDPRHQVLVQEFVGEVALSGVVFTRTLTFGAPYYVVNYDDVSASTSSVTDGGGRHLKTWVAHRDLPREPERAPERLRPLMAAVREVEGLVAYDALDIEFAISGDGRVHLFQIRPLVVDHSRRPGNEEEIAELLRQAERAFAAHHGHPELLGERAMWGDMPDWNPAEILGTRPRALAFSLYRHLVTDGVWARQRREFGYRDLGDLPLMRMVAGHPYIDIRASLNSFIPARLEEPLARRLVAHYQEKLAADHTLHDKIEFEVALTCLTLDFPAEAEALRRAGFDEGGIESLRAALAGITRHALERYRGDLERLETLVERHRRTVESPLPPLEKAFLLLRDCRRYGTLPFAHLARGAFVAVALLRSLVSRGLIDATLEQAFLASLKTVAKEFSEETAAVVDGAGTQQLVEKYGHLRPGTYEITSRSYREEAERVFAPRSAPVAKAEPPPFRWPESLRVPLETALRELGVETTLPRLDAFLRGTIEGREYAKFLFTRSLSVALDCLILFGEESGVSRDELSHISLPDLEQLLVGRAPADPVRWLRERAREGREMHRLAQTVELPSLLLRAEELWAFHYPESRPTFVGGGVVSAPLCGARAAESGLSLDGRIVLLEQADPGYDWIFNHRIVGLVTAYGGANSHMAIRAAEFGLPSVLGVGSQRFAELSRYRSVTIDCDHRRLEGVQ